VGSKAPIEIIGMGEPFSDPHGRNILYRYVTEKHRDGRIRTILRGRDFRGHSTINIALKDPK